MATRITDANKASSTVKTTGKAESSKPFLPVDLLAKISTQGLRPQIVAGDQPRSTRGSGSQGGSPQTLQMPGPREPGGRTDPPPQQPVPVDPQSLADMRATVLGNVLGRPNQALDQMGQIAAHRFAYMPSVADVNAIARGGPKNWLLGQLNFDNMDFAQSYWSQKEYVRYFRDYWGNRFNPTWHEPVASPPVEADVIAKMNLDARTFLRDAALTKKPFLHRWASFFMNHFSVTFASNVQEDYELRLQAHPYFKEAILEKSLGKFEDMLKAVMRSPAMLIGLGSISSSSGSGSNYNPTPLQNHARELLELHTVGVDAGYTQVDVEEISKLLTGLRYLSTNMRTIKGYNVYGGEFFIDTFRHDHKAKNIPFLDISIPDYWYIHNNGQHWTEEQVNFIMGHIDNVLVKLARHPATAKRMARKIIYHFYNEDLNSPITRNLAAKLEQVWLQTDGNLLEVAKTMVSDTMSFHPAGFKAKPPMDLMIGLLRSGNLVTAAGGAAENLLLDRILTQNLPALNQPYWQAPDVRGFLVENARWMNDNNILPLYENVGPLAANIAANIPATDFYFATIGRMPVSGSGSASIATMANPNAANFDPVSAVLLTIMSPENLMRR